MGKGDEIPANRLKGNDELFLKTIGGFLGRTSMMLQVSKFRTQMKEVNVFNNVRLFLN